MADRRIGELSKVEQLNADDLLAVEHAGEARSFTANSFANFAREAIQAYTGDAAKEVAKAAEYADSAKEEAAQAAHDAAQAAKNAEELAKQLAALYALTVSARGLPPGEEPTVTVTFVEGFANFLFGIPEGEKGEQGVQGEQGVGVDHIELVEGDHSPGTTDTYQVVLTDGHTEEFYVTNGRDGEQGPQGEKGDRGLTGPTGPAGKDGAKGDTGPAGPIGPQGPAGKDGADGKDGKDAIVTEADGQYAFQIEDGDLILYYTGETQPGFSLEDDGHLYLEVS